MDVKTLAQARVTDVAADLEFRFDLPDEWIVLARFAFDVLNGKVLSRTELGGERYLRTRTDTDLFRDAVSWKF